MDPSHAAAAARIKHATSSQLREGWWYVFAGAVLDGRDVGTVVCPDATAKLFVTAAVAVRAQRRYKELLERHKQHQLQLPPGEQQQQQLQLTMPAGDQQGEQQRQKIPAGVEEVVISYEKVLQEMEARDARDVGRSTAPCIPAADALVLDTSSLRIQEVFQVAVKFIEKKMQP